MTMTALELSFQFPIKRDGASPVAASVAAGVSAAADSDAIGSADAEIEGSVAGAASSFSLFEFEITIAPRSTTPTRTARRVLLDEPWRGAADGAADLAAVFGATGVVDTLTRADPVAGTGGITTLAADDFFAADFLAAFLGAAFLVVVFFLATAFLATAFLATFFFATVFFAAAFFAGDFFATDFLATFLGAAFLAADFFFTATVFLLELCNGGI